MAVEAMQTHGASSESEKGNEGTARGLPAWLDSRTAALIGTILMVGLGLAAMNQASESATRAELGGRMDRLDMRMESMDNRLSARIEDVRQEFLSEIKAVERRLRLVELNIVAIRAKLGLANPADGLVPPPEDERSAHQP